MRPSDAARSKAASPNVSHAIEPCPVGADATGGAGAGAPPQASSATFESR